MASTWKKKRIILGIQHIEMICFSSHTALALYTSIIGVKISKAKDKSPKHGKSCEFLWVFFLSCYLIILILRRETDLRVFEFDENVGYIDVNADVISELRGL